MPGEPEADVQIGRIAGIARAPPEIGREQGRRPEDLEPVLDAGVGQVDAVQVLVEEFVEGVDLVADVGGGIGWATEHQGKSQQPERATGHVTSST